MDEMKETLVEQEQPALEQAPVDIAKIIEELKEGGLSDEQVLEALAKMVEEGKIAEQDLEKAKELLANAMGEEKAQAEKLFGVENLL